MSDTPRTDEVELHYRRMEDRDAPSYVAPAEFARQLERENAELADQVMRWFKAASPYATPGSLEEGLKKRQSTQSEMKDSGWRPVSEKPPCANHYIVTVTYLDGEKRVRDGYYSMGGEWDSRFVTHWMHKPEAA